MEKPREFFRNEKSKSIISASILSLLIRWNSFFEMGNWPKCCETQRLKHDRFHRLLFLVTTVVNRWPANQDSFTSLLERLQYLVVSPEQAVIQIDETILGEFFPFQKFQHENVKFYYLSSLKYSQPYRTFMKEFQ